MDSQVGKIVFVAGAIVIVLMGGVFVVFFADENKNLIMAPLGQFTITSSPNDILTAVLQPNGSHFTEASNAISDEGMESDVGSGIYWMDEDQSESFTPNDSVSVPTMMSNSLAGIGGGASGGYGSSGSGYGSGSGGGGGSSLGGSGGGSGSGNTSEGNSSANALSEGSNSSGGTGAESLISVPPDAGTSGGGSSLLGVPSPVIPPAGAGSSSSGGGSAPVIRHNPELPPGMLGYFGFALSGVIYWLRKKFKI